MRIFFIVDETYFFLPQWADRVISGLDKEDKVVGITPLITKDKPTFYNQVEKNIFKFPSLSIAMLVYRTGLIILNKFLFDLGLISKPKSIVQVAKKYKIKIVKTLDINSKTYLKNLKNLKPDLIISSCSQIFQDRLLSLPKVTCINRHSALLPSYKGVFPVFWAMLKGERIIGASVHYMTKDIDSGKVIYQIPIKVAQKDTLFILYEKAYQVSVDATLQAIQALKGKQKPRIIKGLRGSYFSFPTQKDWQLFFKKNYRFI